MAIPPFESNTNLKTQAAILRVGLMLDLFTVEDAIAWAEQQVAAETGEPLAQLLEICWLKSHQSGDVISLLGQTPGEEDRAAVGRNCAAAIYDALANGRFNTVRAVQAMSSLRLWEYSPDRIFLDASYEFECRVDLALEGYENLTDVHRSLLSFLASYAERAQQPFV